MTHDMTPLIHMIAPMVSAPPGHRLIFAFDTMMMQEDRFKKSCPSARRIATARLLSRRFIFNEDGIAAIAPCRGSVVHGLVWEITEQEQSHLEFLLNVPVKFDRYGAFARGRDHEMIAVEYYAPRNRQLGKSNDSMEIVQLLAVAHRWRFPDSYLDEIEKWAPRSVGSNRLRLIE